MKQWTINFAHGLKDRIYPCEVIAAYQKAVTYLDMAAVEGDAAEFGCWNGRSTRVLYRALKRTPRILHVFDSFDGLPDSSEDADAPQVVSGDWKRGAFRGITPESLQRSCPKAVIHRGWYSNIMRRLDPAVRFGLIHVDCDLYQSTMDALTPLFRQGQVTQGALILWDDWDSNRAREDCGERRAWGELSKLFKIQFEDGGSYGWTQKRMIVHGYEKTE